MYKEIKKINQVYSLFDFYKKLLICNIGNGKEAHITFYDENFEQFNQLKNTAYDFLIANNQLIFTTQTIVTNASKKILKSFSVDLTKIDLEIELSYTLHLKGVKQNNKFLCIGNQGYADSEKEKQYYIINLDTLTIVTKINIPTEFKKIEIFNDNFFIATERRKGKIGLFSFDVQCEWEYNLGEEAKYIHWDGLEKNGEIKNIYHQDNNILVLTTCYLICLDFQGNLIYKTRFPDLLRAQTLVINKALGYIYNYHDFVIIDLATGEIIFHKEIKSFEYKNEEFNNFAQDLIYNEGLLFHSVTSRGLSFIVAINSETGETIWRKHITNQNINTIRFHQKNMFVLDGGSTLHIFEKTEKR